MIAPTLKLTFSAAPVKVGELRLVILGMLMVEVTLDGVTVGRVVTDGVTVGRRIIGGVTVVSNDESGGLVTTEEVVIEALMVTFGGNKVGGSVKFKNGGANSGMELAETVVDTDGWIVKIDPVGLQWQSVKSQLLAAHIFRVDALTRDCQCGRSSDGVDARAESGEVQRSALL